MFDHIKFSDKMFPDVKQGVEYQTKSLDCVLGEYEVDESGMLREAGMVVPYHGYINFYGTDRSDSDNQDYMWYEYDAKFTDGRCVEVVAAGHAAYCQCNQCKAEGKEPIVWPETIYQCRRCGKDAPQSTVWRVDFSIGRNSHCEIFCSEECATFEVPVPHWSWETVEGYGIRGPK